MNSTALVASLSVLLSLSAAAVVVDVQREGVTKKSVKINVANPAYAQCLKRNLELTGLFVVSGEGTIRVSGTPGSAVTVEGDGKRLTATTPVSDAASARMAARRLSDAMSEAYGRQKGFACDRIAFVNRKGPDNAELCMSYPDGLDVRQLTSDGKGIVGPRWKDANTLFYTFLKAGPQIYEYNLASQTRRLRWGFKGLTTGAAVSPDGSRIAIILSFQGNPELYIVDWKQNYVRLTTTPNASEGSPSWSPDGRQIVYVSNESRHPHLYVVDVATKKKRRLTTRGSQNFEPDWGKDGRIVYISQRAGHQIAVIDPKVGESSTKIVSSNGSWQHPSWARDGRHVVASQGNALYVVDTMENGDEPKRVFSAKGRWTDPCWCK